VVTDLRARISSGVAYGRANGVRIGLELLVNFIGPFAIYSLLDPKYGDVKALMASSAPPIAWSLVEFIRRRRVDALSILVLAGIALSLLAFLGGGGVKFLQLREKLVTAAIGLVFLGSAAIGRPLIYVLARATMLRRSAAEAQELEALKDNVYFRRTMTLMTLVWGFGLVAEASLAGALVFALSVREFMIVSPIIGYSTAGVLSGWTFWYARRQRRKGAERRAAAEASAAAAPSPLHADAP
jgi:putative Mn2+ efflux pump MntP